MPPIRSPYQQKGSHITIVWNALLSLIVLAVGAFVFYFVQSWTLWAYGYHIHHFIFGLFAIGVGIYSLISTGITFTISNQWGSLALKYMTIPLVSSIVYFGIGAFLILSELPLFMAWVSNPQGFCWSCP